MIWNAHADHYLGDSWPMSPAGKVNLILSGCSSLKPFHCNADHPFLCGSVVPVYSVWERLQKSFSHIPTLRCICFYSVAKHSAVFYHILLDCEKVNSTWVEFCKSTLFHLSSVVIPQDMFFHEHDEDDVCRQSYGSQDKSSPVIEVNQDALLMDYQSSSPSVFATYSWIQFMEAFDAIVTMGRTVILKDAVRWSHLLTHCLSIFSLSKSNHFYIVSTHITVYITVPHVCGSWMIVNYLNLWETLLFLVWNHGEAKPLSAPLFCTAAHHNPHSQTQYFARPHWPDGFFGLTLLLFMHL